MFSQLYDFNLVCCAIATVSAAVGYRYTRKQSERRAGISRAFVLPQCTALPRRRNSEASDVSMDTTPLVTEREASDSSSLDYPTPQSIGDVTEPGSLKRKHRDDAANDANTNSSDDIGEADVSLASLYEPPRKRCRTPSENNEQPGRAAPSSGSEDPPVSNVDLTSPMARDSGDLMTQDSEASIPIAFPVSAIATVQSSQTAQAGLSFSIPACKPSSAFAAFAGVSSAFSTTAQIGAQKPAWCSAAPSIAGPSSDVFKPKPTPPAEPCIEPADAEPSAEVQSTSAAGESWTPAASVSLSTETPEANPLVALTFAKSTHVGTTGEEDEDITSELRGVKLFIKRGTGDFSTGMTGHVKLLSHRTDGGERVVLRREPVWKVSMCVGLGPAVRCSFDEDQGVLRIVLKEAVSKSAEEGDEASSREPQVVLYALKRGRVARDEFEGFAREVVRRVQARRP